jgi:hypothetical protein
VACSIDGEWRWWRDHWTDGYHSSGFCDRINDNDASSVSNDGIVVSVINNRRCVGGWVSDDSQRSSFDGDDSRACRHGDDSEGLK